MTPNATLSQGWIRQGHVSRVRNYLIWIIHHSSLAVMRNVFFYIIIVLMSNDAEEKKSYSNLGFTAALVWDSGN